MVITNLLVYCYARKKKALVEYALSGLNNQLFISKYQLALPNKDEIKNFLESILRETHLVADVSKEERRDELVE